MTAKALRKKQLFQIDQEKGSRHPQQCRSCLAGLTLCLPSGNSVEQINLSARSIKDVSAWEGPGEGIKAQRLLVCPSPGGLGMTGSAQGS